MTRIPGGAGYVEGIITRSGMWPQDGVSDNYTIKVHEEGFKPVLLEMQILNADYEDLTDDSEVGLRSAIEQEVSTLYQARLRRRPEVDVELSDGGEGIKIEIEIQIASYELMHIENFASLSALRTKVHQVAEGVREIRDVAVQAGLRISSPEVVPPGLKTAQLRVEINAIVLTVLLDGFAVLAYKHGRNETAIYLSSAFFAVECLFLFALWVAVDKLGWQKQRAIPSMPSVRPVLKQWSPLVPKPSRNNTSSASYGYQPTPPASQRALLYDQAPVVQYVPERDPEDMIMHPTMSQRTLR